MNQTLVMTCNILQFNFPLPEMTNLVKHGTLVLASQRTESKLQNDSVEFGAPLCL